MLWNLALFGLLIWLDRKRSLRPGSLLPIYVGGYFLGRLWIEALRSDTATKVFGLRVNIWISIIGIGGALIVVVARGLRRRPDDDDEPYRDGHRWTPPGADVPPGAADAAEPSDELSDEPSDEEDDQSSAGVSDAPAGGPPPT
jgi:hypothetical protein